MPDGSSMPRRAAARPSAPQWPLDAGITVVLFAGLGGACEGLEDAGCPVAVANNHDDIALAAHQERHPHTRHIRGDIFDVDPLAATRGARVKVLWASPDCFPPGTMVLTRTGYRPIEEIEIGDEVLTHRRRWRRVIQMHCSHKPLLRIKGHGHPGLLVSEEHPFLARRRPHEWQNDIRQYRRVAQPVDWVSAGELGEGWYWAAPTEFPTANVRSIPVYGGRETTITPAVMWLVGRYLADGWTRLTDSRAEIVITCGDAKLEDVRQRLSAWPRVGERCGSDELSWHERHTGTAHQFAANHRGLVEWLRQHFGHGAASKTIPGWALGMSKDLRASLLEGYVAGDGWTHEVCGNPCVDVSTVSKALAFGIKALAASLGKTVTVFHRAAGSGQIQGRAVNVLPAWHLRWRVEAMPSHAETMREDGIEWAPVRSRSETGISSDVFNIAVEEDESYVVEGIIVHNCRDHSVAKGSAPRSPRVRSLAWQVCRWAGTVAPEVIFLENVREIRGWGPLIAMRDRATGRVMKLDGSIAAPGEVVPLREQHLTRDKRRLGRSFRRFTAHLRGLGYAYEDRDLCCADFGVPTTRRRYFAVARRDGAPIAWPERTHAPRADAQRLGLLPWVAASTVIDWSLPIQSIFTRKRPLAEATMRRIAAGLRRYVLEDPQPFLVPLTHRGPPRVHLGSEPLRTITTAHRGELAVIAPVLTGCGGRAGQVPPSSMRDPLGTSTTKGDRIVVAATLVAAWMVQHNLGRVGHPASVPISTLTTAGTQQQVATATLAKLRGTSSAASAEEPCPTLTAGGNHVAAVVAFMTKYYGEGGVAQGCAEPLATLTTLARFGVVTVAIAGQPYIITDIGMRMLAPEEAAAAHELTLPSSIMIDGERRPLTKSQAMRLIGNSVPKRMAKLLAEANAIHALAGLSRKAAA